MSASAASLKTALEDLLRARRLQAEAPPLRGEELRSAYVPSGTLETLLGGGFPRGQLSEVYGPASSGRTGIALALVARVTRGGALAAWVDPADRLDPPSAAEAGVDLERFLWLRGAPRGRGLPDALSAVATLVGSRLFEAVVLDASGVPAGDLRRLPGASWIRLQRAVENTTAALVLIASAHTACSPGGASLALQPAGPRFNGAPGPGRLLRGLGVEAQAGRYAPRRALVELRAL